jgi:hypothetical protein
MYPTRMENNVSQSRSTSRSWAQAARLSVVTAAACVIVLVSSAAPSAAQASSNGPKLWTSAAAGSVWFAHQGDHLYLCDHRLDGHSVVVLAEYTRQSTGRKHAIESWYRSGPDTNNGCKDVNIDAVEGKPVEYLVCLGHYPDPAEVTCSSLGRGIA